MHGKESSTDIFISFNGEKIANLQTIEATIEKDAVLEDGMSMRLFNGDATVTMTDIKINEEYINDIILANQLFTVVGTGYKLPKGKRMPKRKRLRKKWMKKYKQSFTLENCQVSTTPISIEPKEMCTECGELKPYGELVYG